MSHSQSVSHSQVPFDTSDSMGEAGLPAFGCSGSVLQSLQFMKPTQSVAEVQYLCYLLLKTKRTKQQLWQHQQQQVHGKQCEALPPSHREKLEHLHILFHEDRDTWLCVPQHLVDKGSFNTSFDTFFDTFQRKKKYSADSFPSSKSQEKHGKIWRGGSLLDNAPRNRGNQEDFLRALFWRVSRDKSLLQTIISDQNSCQLKTI